MGLSFLQTGSGWIWWLAYNKWNMAESDENTSENSFLFNFKNSIEVEWLHTYTVAQQSDSVICIYSFFIFLKIDYKRYHHVSPSLSLGILTLGKATCCVMRMEADCQQPSEWATLLEESLQPSQAFRLTAALGNIFTAILWDPEAEPPSYVWIPDPQKLWGNKFYCSKLLNLG